MARAEFERNRSVTDLVRIPRSFMCVPFATNAGLLLLHSQEPYSLSALDGQDRMGEHGEVY